MGLPYNGHMPDFSQRAGPGAYGHDAAPLSPTARARRQLRQEQDEAFHASLQVCLVAVLAAMPLTLVLIQEQDRILSWLVCSWQAGSSPCIEALRWALLKQCFTT